jgi:hypothetical protein
MWKMFQIKPTMRSIVLLISVAAVSSASSQDLAQSSNKKPASGAPSGAIPCWRDSDWRFPKQYAIGLRLDRATASRHDQNAIETEIGIFIKDHDRRIFPVISATGGYFILCRNQDLPPSPATKVRLVPTAERINQDLFRLLDEESNDLRRWRAVPFRRSGSGTLFINWPYQQTPNQMLLQLIQRYVEQGGHDLLRDPDKPVAVTLLLPNHQVVWPQAIEGVRTAPPTTNVAAQEQQPPPPLGENSPVNPQPVAPPQVAPPPRTQFTIGFQDRARWKDVRLNEPGRLSTFEFCDDGISRNDEDFSYLLQCTPAQDGKIPVKIRGFQLVFVTQAEARQIDIKLDVRGFRTPYPPNWARGGYIEVSPGPLADVLRRPLTLEQAIANAPACKENSGIGVVEIVNQQIRLPSPPCVAYQLEFEPGLTDNTAQVDNYCLAGPSGPQPIVNARVTCWRNRNQPGTPPLTLKLLSGFRSFPYPLPSEPGVHRIGFNSVIGLLIPVRPYSDASPFNAATLNGEAPRYVAKSVEYLNAAGQPVCVPTGIQTQSPEWSMPSLKDAGCQEVPAKARMQVVRDDQAPPNAPLKAFLNTYLDEYELRSVRGPRTESVEKVKVPLEVRFDDGRARDYTARFRGGRNPPAGVHVFPGSGERCGNPHDGKLVKFNDQFNRQKFTWPQVGAVYDERSSEPRKLTPCTSAMLGEERTGEVYLTFDLDPIVASGPRRVIIVANSQGVQRGGISNGVQSALKALVDALTGEHRNRAPLSPISVYSMDNQEKLRPLFTGEDAARNPGTAKNRLTDWDIAAPKTPDLGFLKDQPEMREAERLILVMDGSFVNDANTGALFALARRLTEGEGGGVTFYITGSCGSWPARNEVRGFECFQLPQQDLAKRFGELVLKRDDRANSR